MQNAKCKMASLHCVTLTRKEIKILILVSGAKRNEAILNSEF